MLDQQEHYPQEMTGLAAVVTTIDVMNMTWQMSRTFTTAELEHERLISVNNFVSCRRHLNPNSSYFRGFVIAKPLRNEV